MASGTTATSTSAGASANQWVPLRRLRLGRLSPTVAATLAASVRLGGWASKLQQRRAVRVLELTRLTANSTTFDSAGYGLVVKGLTAGCYWSQTRVSILVLDYSQGGAGLDQGPLLCRNSTQCVLPTRWMASVAEGGELPLGHGDPDRLEGRQLIVEFMVAPASGTLNVADTLRTHMSPAPRLECTTSDRISDQQDGSVDERCRGGRAGQRHGSGDDGCAV